MQARSLLSRWLLTHSISQVRIIAKFITPLVPKPALADMTEVVRFRALNAPDRVGRAKVRLFFSLSPTHFYLRPLS